VKRLIHSTIPLALLASLIFVASPAAAQAVDRPAGEQASAAPETAPTLFAPAPIEQAKPLMCGPHEETFYSGIDTFPFDGSCETTCTTFCQDNGGYLLKWSYDERALNCNCTCCR